MPWFPTTRDSSSGWRFDIVGLLAVIGESTIADHTQAITASGFSWIPRLIPAPQALLKNERPNRLPSIQGIELVGVYSGTRVHELNYFANALHDIASLEDYEFREYRITYTKPQVKEGESDGSKTQATTDTPKHNPNDTKKSEDVEHGSHGYRESPPVKLPTITIPMRSFCPLNVLTFISTLMTAGLFIWAALIHDGVACIAIATISFSTCLACQSSQWKPRLTIRQTNAVVPKGDMVIMTRGGALVVVHCEERIARELYTGTEKCEYVYDERTWSGMVATSTMLLMVSVVLLGNCKWTMQAATGAGYIILNGLYWGLPLLVKEKHNWDMSRYHVEQIDPDPATGEVSKALQLEYHGDLEYPPNFTRTLAYAILATKENGWVKKAGFAPLSDAWTEWLDMALEKARANVKHWDAVAAKDALMKKTAAAQSAAVAGVTPVIPA